MLRFGDEKMSKSLGNVERLADALDEWGAETLLLLFARRALPQPDGLQRRHAQARRAPRARACASRCGGCGRAAGDGSGDALIVDEAHRRAAAFDAALDDDLATPAAIAELFELSRLANRVIDSQALSARGAATVADVLLSRLDVLGLAGYGSSDAEVPAEVVKLAEERRGARAARDFARADELRDEIAAAGFVVRDAGDGYELVPATR